MQDSILLSIDNSSPLLMKKRKSLVHTSRKAIANPTTKTIKGIQTNYIEISPWLFLWNSGRTQEELFEAIRENLHWFNPIVSHIVQSITI